MNDNKQALNSRTEMTTTLRAAMKAKHTALSQASTNEVKLQEV